jgi:hypothetical protein
MQTVKGFTDALPVSTTRAMYESLVLFTLVKLALPLSVTLVKLAVFIGYYWQSSTRPVRHDITCVNDTVRNASTLSLTLVKCVQIPVILYTKLILYQTFLY